VRLKENIFLNGRRGGKEGVGGRILLKKNGRRRGNEEERKKMGEGE
jgi:hypothetical protein